MAISEKDRHDLFNRVEAVLGPQSAEAMMELLPPVGWADVATKHDLGAIEERFDLRLAALEERFDLRLTALENRLGARFSDQVNAQTRSLMFALVGTVTSVGALVIAATALS